VARFQAWLFFPMLLLEGLNLHLASISEAVAGLRGRPGRPAGRGEGRLMEAGLLAVHHVGYLAALLLVLGPVRGLVFLLVNQAVFGVYMGCSFAPNHKGMPVLGPDERPDFLRGQVLTSRNIRGGWPVHLLLGGLGTQIEHHLFPSMPRPALLRARPIVRAFCAERGVAYRETSLIESYALVLRHLDDAGAGEAGTG
jgi:fatty acid desaturase